MQRQRTDKVCPEQFEHLNIQEKQVNVVLPDKGGRFKGRRKGGDQFEMFYLPDVGFEYLHGEWFVVNDNAFYKVVLCPALE